MVEQPLVSIIITNYNGKKYLRNCLDSLFSGSYRNIETIFVDNGSGDGSIDFVKSNFPQALIVDNRQNLGLAVASNNGAQQAKGKYLFFYNNDTIADQFLIERLVKKMEQSSEVGICGCRTLTYDGKTLINEGVTCDIFGYPYGKEKVFYVDAAIFVRRDLFSKLGGFDERMFLYGEDRDICWRCWLYGYKVAALKDSVFYHDSACTKEDITQYRTNIHRRFWGEFNSLRILLKNYSLGFLLVILPIYMGINLAEICAFLLKGKLRIARDVYLRSYLTNLRVFPDTLKKRSRFPIFS